MKAAIKWLLPVAVGLAIWLIPRPDGVKADGWTVLAIFVATVLGLILQPAPLAVVALTGMTLTMLTGAVSEKTVLAGFGNSVIWLAVMAFFIARGFDKTGLGKRIALLFVRAMGKRSLGLGYGLALTDLVLAPATPSITARAGGVIFPVLKSLATLSGSEPHGPTRRRLGAYLCVSAMQVNTVTAAMFATAMAANPVVQRLAADQHVKITWTGWAVAAIVPGLLSLAVTPLLTHWIFPPEQKLTPEAPAEARRQLAAMGPMSGKEWIMAGTFVLLLVLWSAGDTLWGLSATTAAFVGVCLLLLTGVITWQDALAEKAAWTTVIWFAALIMMAGQLLSTGVIGWFSKSVEGTTRGMGWLAAFLLLSVVYYFAHYLFASNTAHIAAMYVPFLATAIAAGTPPALAAITLGFASSLFGGLTHYASGPAPVLFGGGYTTLAEWWRIGLAVSVVNLAIWIGVGGLWLKVLGYW